MNATLQILLIGTGRLRRRIALQRRLLDQQLALTQLQTHQLHEAVVARTTSPLTLGLTCLAGFTAGLLSRRSRPLPSVARFAMRHSWPLLLGGVQAWWLRHHQESELRHQENELRHCQENQRNHAATDQLSPP